MSFALGFLAPLLRLPRWVYGVVAAMAALGLLWALHGHWERTVHDAAYNEGWNALAAKDTAAAAKAAAINVKANSTADSERSTDTINIATDKGVRDAAINNAPASDTGAASRAANCVRWSRSHPGAKPPSACR